jgi:hypothetical protein
MPKSQNKLWVEIYDFWGQCTYGARTYIDTHLKYLVLLLYNGVTSQERFGA